MDIETQMKYILEIVKLNLEMNGELLHLCE
jgi:hypothetical protein